MPVFVDHLVIHARAGHGGNGSVHFRRVKFNPKAGPDGGDGGDGGDLIFQVDPSTDSLRNFFYQSRLAAEDGRPGSERNCTGRSGKDKIYKVPPGTRIHRLLGVNSLGQAAAAVKELSNGPTMTEDNEAPGSDNAAESDIFEPNDSDPDIFEPQGAGPRQRASGHGNNLHGENYRDDADSDDPDSAANQPFTQELVGDLLVSGEKFILCHGGKGGRGNLHFTTATNRAPTEAEPGEPGEEGYFHLELRSIADAGLVGFPNAGKSTLLGALSAAQPKIGAYPFTTLQPKVGVIDFDGWSRCTVADIPGILQDAHKGKGLGLDFLRHIMRCRTLLFVVDTPGSEGRHPVTDLEILRAEVSAYSEELAARPWVIIANKMDHPDAEAGLEALHERFPRREILPISAKNGTGLEELRRWLQQRLGHNPENEASGLA